MNPAKLSAPTSTQLLVWLCFVSCCLGSVSQAQVETLPADVTAQDGAAVPPPPGYTESAGSSADHEGGLKKRRRRSRHRRQRSRSSTSSSTSAETSPSDSPSVPHHLPGYKGRTKFGTESTGTSTSENEEATDFPAASRAGQSPIHDVQVDLAAPGPVIKTPKIESRPVGTFVAGSASRPTPTGEEALTGRRLQIRAGTSSTHSSQLNADLHDAATVLGAEFDLIPENTKSGLAGPTHSWPFETGAALDFLFGSDRSITVQNTRMIMLTGHFNYFFLTSTRWTPFVGIDAGLANYDVKTFQSAMPGVIVATQYAKGTAFLAAPGAGCRLSFNDGLNFDLRLQYDALLGSASARRLGGLTALGSFGFIF
jgi:hypothetical protein